LLLPVRTGVSTPCMCIYCQNMVVLLTSEIQAMRSNHSDSTEPRDTGSKNPGAFVSVVRGSFCAQGSDGNVCRDLRRSSIRRSDVGVLVSYLKRRDRNLRLRMADAASSHPTRQPPRVTTQARPCGSRMGSRFHSPRRPLGVLG